MSKSIIIHDDHAMYYIPLLNRKRVCTGIPNFLIFYPKHTLWVLVRRNISIDIPLNLERDTKVERIDN